MKIFAGVMVLLAVIYFFPAFQQMQRGHAISGSTTEQVKKSAIQVRRTMATNERNLFDTAFGILEKIKSPEGPEAFPKAVSGLKPEEVVDLAKREVDIRIAAGDPDFKSYTSWDDMVTKLTSDTPKKSGHANATAVPLRQSERTGRPN
jgi:hypothetical protein